MTERCSRSISPDSLCGAGACPTAASALSASADCHSIAPDSLTGMIFFLEGIRHTVVLLNGPMGCKFYHSTTSEHLTYHPALYLLPKEGSAKVPVDYNFLNDWFFRQSRVPCTYLDGYDFVYGSAEKVREALTFLRENVDFDLLAIVNSPGASLIGDNLTDIAAETLPDKPYVILESPGLSTSFAQGYDAAAVEVFRQVYPKVAASWATEELAKGLANETAADEAAADEAAPADPAPAGVAPAGAALTPAANAPTSSPCVNILGMSIFDRNAEGDRMELERLLGLCGIRVNAMLGCGNTLDELARVAQADLNVTLYADRTRAATEQLRRLGVTNVLACEHPPIGFAATRAFVEQICHALGLPLSEAFIYEEELARARAFRKIDSIYQLTGLPVGVTFAVKGSEAQVAGYRSFLEDYLGMVFCPDEDGEADAELVFGDANSISERIARGKVFCGIEINNPQMGYIDLIPKTHLGIQGALFLIEQVLSGLMSRT